MRDSFPLTISCAWVGMNCVCVTSHSYFQLLTQVYSSKTFFFIILTDFVSAIRARRPKQNIVERHCTHTPKMMYFFRVPVENDWLNLNTQATSQKSYAHFPFSSHRHPSYKWELHINFVCFISNPSLDIPTTTHCIWEFTEYTCVCILNWCACPYVCVAADSKI